MVLFLVININLSKMFAQIDTAFWFGAPWITQGHNTKVPIAFRFASFNYASTTIRLRQPAGTLDTTFTIGPNIAISKFLNWMVNSTENTPGNVVLNRGFKISSNNPITVVYDVVTPTPYNPETFSVKGQNGLGTEFVCPFQTNGNNGPYIPAPKSQIIVVATDYNTVIWVTPKCNVVGHLAGITYSVPLSYGQSYLIENVSSTPAVPGQNLGGTIVVSNKPVAVTVADDSVGGVGGCYDLMGDQIVPVDIIGKDYIVVKGQLNAAQYAGVYIVATQNFTKIRIDDGAVTTYTMNKGDSYFYKTTQPRTYVNGDKNIYVLHVEGFGCELGEALLPPLNCAGSDIITFARNNTDPFFLNILCKQSMASTFTLSNSSNTITIPSFATFTVPGTATLTGGPYCSTQLTLSTAQVPSGVATTVFNLPGNLFALGVYNGTPGGGCLYHYLSSFIRKVYTTAGPDQNWCTGTSPVINIAGNVSGGAVTGSWTPVNGSGTFGSTTSFTTTYTLSGSDITQGSVKLVLSSTGNCTPVTDTMEIFIRQSSQVTASATQTLFCKNNVLSIPITGTKNSVAVGSLWTGGGGSFANPGVLTTTYTPSPADLSAGFITLTLTTSGNVFGCPEASATLSFSFTNPPTVNAGPDLNVCTNSGTVVLNGTVSAGSTTGIWTTPGSGGFVPTNTTMNTSYILSASDLTQSNIKIKLTSTNNGLCNAVSDSILVTIIQKPTVNAGADDTLCASAGIVAISGTVSGSSSTGVWSTLGGGVFGNPNLLVTTYSLSASDVNAGFIKLILSSAGGACPSVADTVTYVLLNAPIVSAGTSTTVCKNAVIQLNGNVSGFTSTGIWSSTGTGSFSPSNTSLGGLYFPSSLDVSIGTLTLTLLSTNNKGCSASSDKIVISFIPSPAASFTNSTACATQPINFSDNSTPGAGSLSTFNWDFGDGGTSISANTIHSFSFATTYTITHWVTSSNGCVDTVRKTITVFGLPIADFSIKGPCEDLQTQFSDGSSITPGNIVSWNWNFADGSKDTTNKNPKHVFTNPGIFNVNLTVGSSDGCVSSINKPVTIFPKPVADFAVSSNPTLAQETVYFSDFSTPTGSITIWYWNFGDSITSGDQNPSHFWNNAGNYTITLTVSDANGCTDTVSKDIMVTLLPQVPTAFSPNGDNHNDFLKVKGGPFEKMYFRVYNDWGQLLFETKDQDKGWDGTFKGDACPVGVYVWILDVDLFNNKSVRKTGDVTILR